MHDRSQESPTDSAAAHLSEAEVQSLLQLLRRKDGTWVGWGRACQKLQQSGFKSQTIFEETGFEPIHQNQIIVAAQVYESLLKAAASEAVRSHFLKAGSDILYEFRILSQQERAAATELALAKKLDQSGARELAKVVKAFSRLSMPPDGFTKHPGDAMAYQCWRRARERSDLQERSRLIAQGLQFAHSPSARTQMEQLLTDFTVIPSRQAPHPPVYRQELDEELPRMLPVAGTLPLTRQALEATPSPQVNGTFQLVRSPSECTWVALPGWRVILSAQSPIGILCQSEQLPVPLPGKPEAVLVVVERQFGDWSPESYFLVERGGQLEFDWFETAPDLPLLGQVLLILRPKKIFDEDALTQDWLMSGFDE